MPSADEARQHRLDDRRMRAYRLDRVQKELVKRDYAAALLFDPINIRPARSGRCKARSDAPAV